MNIRNSKYKGAVIGAVQGVINYVVLLMVGLGEAIGYSSSPSIIQIFLFIHLLYLSWYFDFSSPHQLSHRSSPH